MKELSSMSKIITESEVEQVALDILSELKYKVIYGPDIAPFDAAAVGGLAHHGPEQVSEENASKGQDRKYV